MRPVHAGLRPLAPWVVATAVALAALLPTPAAAQSACQREPQLARPAVAATLATVALNENAHMGGSLIDESGGLIQQGFYEAERDHLPGDEPAWRRVWNYWRAVPDVYARDFAPLEALGSTAEQRVALIDHPWSAVFISWVMRSAGFTEAQFDFSALHSDYVRAALDETAAEAARQPTDYAYRACDLAQTAPRVGDLLCFARADDASLVTFDAVRAAVLQGSIPMHCDLVVKRDAAHIETVGGNVAQSVTLRRLRLAADGSGRLWPGYLESAHRAQAAALAGQPSAGTAAALLPDTYLSQQPWSVLLQLRNGVITTGTNPVVSPRLGGPPPPITPDSIYRN
ncbi:MAG: DUF2272 domain-containing protein [Burkholderiaceae bacterium]|nr:MAG: DUF2272 domain-containing protein [Burkholderiaceae bacterium]